MHSSIFFPHKGGKTLTQMYPELARAKEIKDLKRPEQEFVWWYACKASPLVPDDTQGKKGLPDLHDRAKKSFELAYANIKYSGDLHQSFVTLKFPDHIKIAVDKMSKFSLDRRVRALEAQEMFFNDCIEVLGKPLPDDVPDDPDNEEAVVGLSAKMIQEHIVAKQKASDSIKTLLPLLEEGYGVTSVDGDRNDAKAIDLYIERKKSDTSRN